MEMFQRIARTLFRVSRSVVNFESLKNEFYLSKNKLNMLQLERNRFVSIWHTIDLESSMWTCSRECENFIWSLNKLYLSSKSFNTYTNPIFQGIFCFGEISLSRIEQKKKRRRQLVRKVGQVDYKRNITNSKGQYSQTWLIRTYSNPNFTLIRNYIVPCVHL
jgi:hypothetical protein